MESSPDPLRGAKQTEENSDDEDFVDAMEELQLKEENPVIFDNSQNSERTESVDRPPIIIPPTNSENEGKIDSDASRDNSENSDSSDSEESSVSDSKVDRDQEIKDLIDEAVKEDAKLLEDEGKEPEDGDDQEILDDIDEGFMKAKEAEMTEEEKEAKKEEAQLLKAEGNDRFKATNYVGALESYTEALMLCPTCYAKERSIMYSNRAATKVKMEKIDSAIEDSTKALEYNPAYLKALLRRAELYEKKDKLDEALADYQKSLEMDPSLTQARAACMRLPDQIKERNEKLKDEMMGKLKDLGNLVLRPFGLSTENFNLQQDPNTGGYSVNFKQS